jgi:hypothetical protein
MLALRCFAAFLLFACCYKVTTTASSDHPLRERLELLLLRDGVTLVQGKQQQQSFLDNALLPQQQQECPKPQQASGAQQQGVSVFWMYLSGVALTVAVAALTALAAVLARLQRQPVEERGTAGRVSVVSADSALEDCKHASNTCPEHDDDKHSVRYSYDGGGGGDYYCDDGDGSDCFSYINGGGGSAFNDDAWEFELDRDLNDANSASDISSALPSAELSIARRRLPLVAASAATSSAAAATATAVAARRASAPLPAAAARAPVKAGRASMPGAAYSRRYLEEEGHIIPPVPDASETGSCDGDELEQASAAAASRLGRHWTVEAVHHVCPNSKRPEQVRLHIYTLLLLDMHCSSQRRYRVLKHHCALTRREGDQLQTPCILACSSPLAIRACTA